MALSKKMTYPLVVDLDGTLIQADLLWEGLLLLFCRAPFKILKALFRELPHGKSRFKVYLANQVIPDPVVLPYNQNVLKILKEAQKAGRMLVLASASPRIWAEAVAKHLGLFDMVLATEKHINLQGNNKLEAIRVACGNEGFDYIGDGRIDISIWNASKEPMVVGKSPSLTRRMSIAGVHATFIPREFMRFAWWKTLRPQQWSKNILLFIPILLAHHFTDLLRWRSLVLAFVAFSLVSSSVYLFNDLFDLEADRYHVRKRLRPIPSGQLSIFSGFVEGIATFVIALTISFYVSLGFSFWLLGYFILSLTYSVWLKRIFLVDVIVLALLYNMRIAAGGFVVAVTVSSWLYAFAIFFFVSLAFVKRYMELYNQTKAGLVEIKRRGYVTSDLPVIFAEGLVSGFISVLIFYIYISISEQARTLYHHPNILSFAGVVLLYWIGRLWFLAHRHEIAEDPVAFALQDSVSMICVLFVIVFFFLAIF